MPRGGKRPGAGKPKGHKQPLTLQKLEMRDLLRRTVAEALQPILASQIANAQGIQHFVLRDKAGKFVRVTSEEAALAAMNDPEAVYEFWTRDPSVQAAAYLLDQALDKAASPVPVTGPEGGPVEVVFRWGK